jgi:hypothetical protein
MKWIAGLIGALALGLAARDAWGWLPRASRLVIWLATLPLPKARRLIRREEWDAELIAEYDDRRLSGLIWALKLCPISVWERATTPIGLFRSTEKVPSRAATIARWRSLALVTSGLVTTASGVATLAQALITTSGLGALIILAVAFALVSGACSLVVARRLKRIQRERADLRLCLRRLGVVTVLEDLDHESTAKSVQDLRLLRNRLGHTSFDFIRVNSEGRAIALEAKHRVAS